MTSNAARCQHVTRCLRSRCGQKILMGVIFMGWSRKRSGQKGKDRYTAYYRDARGKTCVAGTFTNRKDADSAWKTAEVRQAEGRLGDPRRGRQTFQRYVEGEWLPNHVIEVTTREGYTYSIGKHIMPWFGPLRMNQIMPADVREWVKHLTQAGVSATNIRTLKSILSAVFTTALNDQVTFLHPCKGVRTPTVPPRLLTVVTPEQFDILYQALPGGDAQLLVETAIESGLRWGELTELRPRDLNPATCMLTVSRVLVEVNPKFHPDRRAVPGQGLPERKETPPPEAQPPGRRQAHRPRTAQPPRPGRPVLHDGSRGPGHAPPESHPEPCTARADRTEPRWPPVFTRHAQRLQRRPLPVRPLQRSVCCLPGSTPDRWQGRAPAAENHRHRWAYSPQVVPRARLDAGAQNRGPGNPSQGS